MYKFFKQMIGALLLFALSGIVISVQVRALEDEVCFVDTMARDSFFYTLTRTTNGLPDSFWNVNNPGDGRYSNATEHSLYMLSLIAAYDLQESGYWQHTNLDRTDILNRIEVVLDHILSFQSSDQNSFNGLLYQFYSNTDLTVGGGAEDKRVASIENGYLVLGLLTLKQYFISHGDDELVQKIDDILSNLNLRAFWDEDSKMFFHGAIDNPRGGLLWDRFSSEGRVLNYAARALGQLSEEEFHASLDAPGAPTGEYDGIVVPFMNFDGSYFTYLSPGIFVREDATPYQTTINQASLAAVRYSENNGFLGFGFTDTFGIDAAYTLVGSPPAENNEQFGSLVSPHALALALNTNSVNEALHVLKEIRVDVPSVYGTSGFVDAYEADPDNPQFKEVSPVVSSLSTSYIVLAVSQYRTNMIQSYLYQDPDIVQLQIELEDWWTLQEPPGIDSVPIVHTPCNPFIIPPLPGQPDADGDGFTDANDACPWQGNEGGLGVDDTGCPYYDADWDGIYDRDDACPWQGNEGGRGIDDTGCPYYDADWDGFTDDDDACPWQADEYGLGIDATGCPIEASETDEPHVTQEPSVTEVWSNPDVDADWDGFNDDDDACPGQGNEGGLGVDDTGCPYYDADWDGVYDRDDECPDRGNEYGIGVDGAGCPIEPDTSGTEEAYVTEEP